MNLSIENILLVGSLLLLISVIAGKTSYRLGIPTLLFFLAVGMLAGSEGIGGIHFDDPKIAQFIGIVSLNFILFSGGFDTNWSSVKPILRQGIVLSTAGVLLTAIILGSFIWLITGLTFYESMLLGSIVSSTDAAAVFSILSAKGFGLKANLRPTLELESGSNDPLAYVLTISFLTLVMHPERSVFSIIPTFFQQMILGGVAGFLFAKVSRFIINHIKLDYEGLYSVLVIALMFITFSATDALNGNGFLAVYILGLYLGNHDLLHKQTLYKMFDGLAWLMQIVIFLTLGLLVFPSQIVPLFGIGLLISLFLIIVARPVTVFLCLLPFRMLMRRRLYIAWVGLRGAVPIVFATYPLMAGIDKANMIFNIVFFISVSSVLIQGTSLTMVAKWLHVALPEKVIPAFALNQLLQDNPKSALQQIEILPNYFAVEKRIVDLNFPKSAFIAMIKRKGEYIRPGGSTTIQSNDTLMVLADKEEDFQMAYDCLSKGA